MSVFVFGSEFDQGAWKLSEALKEELPDIDFIRTDNVNDLLKMKGKITIMDVVRGIEQPALIGIEDLKERKLTTLHDFDLGFFLQLLDKIGRVSEVRIIGVPEQMDRSAITSVTRMLKG